MGLPVFNYDNTPNDAQKSKPTAQQDPSARARSSIRRRQSIHRGRDAPARIAEQQENSRHFRNYLDVRRTPRDDAPRDDLIIVPVVPSSSVLDWNEHVGSSDARRARREAFVDVPSLIQDATSEVGVAEHAVRDAPTVEVTPADGLGDRIRSLSPVVRNGGDRQILHDDDGWQVMRDTMRPDTSLPSADSSFTGTAASDSFTSTRNASSNEADTQATSTFESAPGATDEDADCVGIDGGMASPSHTDEGDLNAQYLRYMRRLEGFQHQLRSLQAEQCSLQDALVQLDRRWGFANRNRPSSNPTSDPALSSSDTTTSDSWAHLRHPSDRPHTSSATQTFSLRRVPSLRRTESLLPQTSDQTSITPRTDPSARSARAHSFRNNLTQIRDAVRHATAALTSLEQGVTTTPPRLADADPELEHMRGILQRLSQRRDIPDEWWASAGLSRDLVRQQQTQTQPEEGSGAASAPVAVPSTTARESHL